MPDERAMVDRCRFHAVRSAQTIVLNVGKAAPEGPRGSVPKIARLLALAHHWQGMIDRREVRDQAAIAGLVGVSRARVTQVMDLLMLAPEIQEEILFLPRTEKGRANGMDVVTERQARGIAVVVRWEEQTERAGVHGE